MSTDYTAAWEALPHETRDRLLTGAPLTDEDIQSLTTAGIKLGRSDEKSYPLRYGDLLGDFREFVVGQRELEASKEPQDPSDPAAGPASDRE